MAPRARSACALSEPRRLCAAAFLLALFAPASAGGQVLTTVEFSFSNPGARSLGFGGAFVALADDATAAFANPAGLIQLSAPEVSIEGRSWRFSSPYTRGGRVAGQPTGLGIDTVTEPLPGESTADLRGLSFVSLVYPVGKWSFAFFQQQLLNFEMTQEIQGLFAPGSVFAGAWRGPIERGFFDLEITTRALAAGYRVNDRLSLGLGLSYFDPGSHIGGEEYLPDDDTQEAYFGAASFLPQRLADRVDIEMSEGDWGWAVGFLWNLSSEWKLGGAYRQGPELELEGTLIAGPVNDDFAPGEQVTLDAWPWRLPDVYGLGLSFRSRDGHWTAALEWDLVEYSSVIDSLRPRFASSDEELSNAYELHCGGEYAFFAATSVLAFRLGAWLDPDHVVRTTSADPFTRGEFPEGSDEVHLAAGFGVVFDRLQVDFAVDFSDRRDTASLSAIYNF